MARRLKPVKDLSVLIIAPRKHDRQLWAELLKNCGINNPLSVADIEQAVTTVASGQVDVVFVDEAYGAKGIANILIPARDVEFAGGRGVCLVLCSKRATATDVLNARKLGFASLVILPASTDTVRKHLELAARYIPPSDEELGWSTPKAKAEKEGKPMPDAKDDPASALSPSSDADNVGLDDFDGQTGNQPETGAEPSRSGTQNTGESEAGTSSPMAQKEPEAGASPLVASNIDESITAEQEPDTLADAEEMDANIAEMHAPGRSARSAEEEVVFL